MSTTTSLQKMFFFEFQVLPQATEKKTEQRDLALWLPTVGKRNLKETGQRSSTSLTIKKKVAASISPSLVMKMMKLNSALQGKTFKLNAQMPGPEGFLLSLVK